MRATTIEIIRKRVEYGISMLEAGDIHKCG